MAEDLASIANAHITPFTVGFIQINDGTPSPRGSGVLVRCSAVQGILTCGHVLDELPRDGDIGIVHFGVVQNRVHAPRVPADATVKHAIKFYSGHLTKEGPDLAFIPLPEIEFAKLTAFGSVIDLDGQSAKAQRPPPDAANGSVAAVAGIVGQMTDPAAQDGNRVVLVAKGLVNVGHFTSNPMVGEWDQLHFEPKAEPGFVLPTDYRGTSGGGMWRIYARQDEHGNFSHIETRLEGIAYWQDEIGERRTHGIIGHGPRSLYDHLLGEIYRRWPR